MVVISMHIRAAAIGPTRRRRRWNGGRRLQRREALHRERRTLKYDAGAVIRSCPLFPTILYQEGAVKVLTGSPTTRSSILAGRGVYRNVATNRSDLGHKFIFARR